MRTSACHRAERETKRVRIHISTPAGTVATAIGYTCTCPNVPSLSHSAHTPTSIFTPLNTYHSDHSKSNPRPYTSHTNHEYPVGDRSSSTRKGTPSQQKKEKPQHETYQTWQSAEAETSLIQSTNEEGMTGMAAWNHRFSMAPSSGGIFHHSLAIVNDLANKASKVINEPLSH